VNYALIRKNDIANGEGVRVSLFVSGCRHRCKGCFNREAWDFDYGKPFGEAEIEEILKACGHSHIAGLSLLGGEPFEPENREMLTKLCKEFKKRFPQKNIWCYTGFILEELVDAERLFEYSANAATPTDIPHPDENTAVALLREIDVLVDGRFVQELKSPALKFRGSSNQRIIDVPATLKNGAVTLLSGKWERTVGSVSIYE